MAKKTERLENGWVVVSKETYEYYTHSEPPRKPPFMRQLLTDIKGFTTQLLFVMIVLNFIQGINGNRQSIIISCCLLFMYIFMFFSVMRNHQYAPVKRGLIKNIKRHPLLFLLSVAQVVTEDGKTCSIIFNTSITQQLKNDSDVEVLFVYAEKGKHSLAIAFREAGYDVSNYYE